MSNATVAPGALLSVVMLAVLIWVFSFLLPRALRERDPLAVSSVVLAILFTFVGWLMFGERMRS